LGSVTPQSNSSAGKQTDCVSTVNDIVCLHDSMTCAIVPRQRFRARKRGLRVKAVEITAQKWHNEVIGPPIGCKTLQRPTL
jgi:hypothetical protein